MYGSRMERREQDARKEVGWRKRRRMEGRE